MSEATQRYLFVFDDSPEGKILLVAGDPPTAIAPSERNILGDLIEFFGNCCAPGIVGDEWALMKDGAAIPDGFVLIARRDLPAYFGMDFFTRSGIAFQMMSLFKKNRFCGVCGAMMADHPVERARLCGSCGNIVYPVLAPAVIVAVERDGMLLMGHGVNFPKGRYSVLAGFVEPGETLEECVKREIFEESGVRVKNIRYFGSQPWPFPASMMLGFKADWESGDPAPRDGELSDVHWFRREDLPDMPPSVSISRRLIDDWLLR